MKTEARCFRNRRFMNDAAQKPELKLEVDNTEVTNAKRAKPELYLEFDRKRKFVLTLGSICAVEVRLNQSLFKLIKWQDIGFNDIRILLWAGLLDDDPELTLEQVGELFDIETITLNFTKIKVFIETALERAIPALSEADREAVQKQKKKLEKVIKS